MLRYIIWRTYVMHHISQLYDASWYNTFKRDPYFMHFLGYSANIRPLIKRGKGYAY